MYAIQDVLNDRYADLGGEEVYWEDDINKATKFDVFELADDLCHELGVLHGLTCDVVHVLICEFTGHVCGRGKCDEWCRYEYEQQDGGELVVCASCACMMGDAEVCPMCGGRHTKIAPMQDLDTEDELLVYSVGSSKHFALHGDGYFDNTEWQGPLTPEE